MSETPGSLAVFLAARLDEDAAAAVAALDGPWMTGRAQEHLSDDVIYGQSRDWPGHIVQVCNLDYGHNSEADAEHIVRHDPARVLREVEAKRRVLGRHRNCGFGSGYGHGGDDNCAELDDMGSVYGGQPS